MFTFALFLHLLLLFRLKTCHDGGQEGAKKRPFAIYEAYKRGPPPFAERPVPFTPIIFRTKNTEKSHPDLIGKISEKICGKMFWGKGKPPTLCRGRLPIRYERLGKLSSVCKDSIIILKRKRLVVL